MRVVFDVCGPWIRLFFLRAAHLVLLLNKWRADKHTGLCEMQGPTNLHGIRLRFRIER